MLTLSSVDFRQMAFFEASWMHFFFVQREPLVRNKFWCLQMIIWLTFIKLHAYRQQSRNIFCFFLSTHGMICEFDHIKIENWMKFLIFFNKFFDKFNANLFVSMPNDKTRPYSKPISVIDIGNVTFYVIKTKSNSKKRSEPITNIAREKFDD